VYHLAASASLQTGRGNGTSKKLFFAIMMLLIQALDAAYPYVGGIGVIFFLLFVISGRDLFEGGLFSRFTCIVFAVSFASVFVINGVVKAEARHEVLGYLDNLQIAEVSINGERVAAPGAVLDALRSMSSYTAHHSNPEGRILIEIRSERGRLIVRLGRDSGRSDEYWVFYPRYYVSNIDEIDRIRTHLFDKCPIK